MPRYQALSLPVSGTLFERYWDVWAGLVQTQCDDSVYSHGEDAAPGERYGGHRYSGRDATTMTER